MNKMEKNVLAKKHAEEQNGILDTAWRGELSGEASILVQTLDDELCLERMSKEFELRKITEKYENSRRQDDDEY